jgi:hypothetical protein
MPVFSPPKDRMYTGTSSGIFIYLFGYPFDNKCISKVEIQDSNRMVGVAVVLRCLSRQ